MLVRVGKLAGAIGKALGGGATLAFHALTPDSSTYEMLGVSTGTGDLTTTHTSTIYAQDHEGVYRGFGANEPVWEGGRVVTNLLMYSEDFSFSAYWVQTYLSDTNLVTLPAWQQFTSSSINNTIPVAVGDKIIITADIELVSGSGSASAHHTQIGRWLVVTQSLPVLRSPPCTAPCLSLNAWQSGTPLRTFQTFR